MTKENLGRPPLFTPDKARQILEARKAFDGIRMTTSMFIDQLVQAGDLETHCSVVSMRRLLNGTMFPSLKELDEAGVETGKLYDYSKVPGCFRGRPPAEERIDKSSGKILPVFTKRQKIWQEHVLKLADIAAANAGSDAAKREFAGLLHRMETVEQEANKMYRDNEALRLEVQSLKNQVAQSAPNILK